MANHSILGLSFITRLMLEKKYALATNAAPDCRAPTSCLFRPTNENALHANKMAWSVKQGELQACEGIDN